MADHLTNEGKHIYASQTNPLPVTLGHGGAGYDAFGRFRTSNPVTQFDSKQIIDKAPLYWDDQEVSGSGTSSTWSKLKASTTLSVALNTVGKRVRQTFQSFNYQPGKSQLTIMTGNVTTAGGGAGIETGMGAYNGTDGIGLRVVNGVLQMFISSGVTGSTVEESINQEDWNADKLDGAGLSGLTLDPTMAQIFWFDMEWLGVGTVSAGFVINKKFIKCHDFHHSNLFMDVYMSTPNLPLRYWIENDGTGAASDLQHICSTVISEGGQQPIGNLHWHSTEQNFINCNTVGTLYAITGMRLKTTSVGLVTNITEVSMLGGTSDNFEWVMMFNPTVASTFTYADHDNSGLQIAMGNPTGVNTVTLGHEMQGGFVASTKDGGADGKEIQNAIKLGTSIAGVADEIVLCARPLSSNADIYGGMGWRELN
jgi:hypothetical protein